MKKTILTDVVGWTPVIDTVAIDVGITGAVIFGKIWRFCQMTDGECWASQERIANELGISRHTVLDTIKALIEKGYIEEVESGESLQRRTNTYRDTGKAGMKIVLTAGNDLCKNLTGTCEKTEQLPVQKVNTKIVLRNNQESSDAPASSVEQERVPRTADDIREMTRQSLMRGAAAYEQRRQDGKEEVQHFPPDVLQVVGRVCELWMLTPPRPKEGRFSFWIKSARELKTACGEFGLPILDEVHKVWLERQWDVGHPGALITTTTALVGKRRGGDKPVIPVDATEDMTYHWNSELTPEENMRRLKAVQQSNALPQETNNDQAIPTQT